MFCTYSFTMRFFHPSSFRFSSLLLLLFLMKLSVPFPVLSETTEHTVLTGRITDYRTGSPVSYVYLHLEKINRTATSDREGKFRLDNVPQGTWTLVLYRIGYVTQKRSIRIEPGEKHDDIEIVLQPAVISGMPIEIIANEEDVRGPRLEKSSVRISGPELRSNLGSTVAETIAGRPGFSQRTMGATAARPVIRGLGDARVLILQDGERTGDVSYAPPDHSVTIDPISANEIEIARGPSALIYGSNAIGGVINIVRNQIPTSRPTALTGTASMHGFSVNNGISGAVNIKAPYRDDFVWSLDLNSRYGQDYSTPAGSLENTNMLATNSAAGLSYIRPWGYSGLAVSTYLSRYGIPPNPESGHPGGVDLDMVKVQVESQTERLLQNRFFNLIEVQWSYRFYNHKEFEAENIIGTEYNVNTVYATVKGRHNRVGFLNDGVVGFWAKFQDYFIFDRFNLEANSYAASLFTVQDFDMGNWNVEFGLRLDAHMVVPKSEELDSRIGHIRRRQYIGLASSAALVYDFGRGFYAGGSVMHSFRPPKPDELFSRGPHLAAYAFETGNPDLSAERGLGTDLFVRHRSSRFSLETAVYRNTFSNYIYPRDTGRRNIIFADLNDYQYTGVHALFYGLETSGEFRISNHLRVEGMVDYTFAEQKVNVKASDVSGTKSSGPESTGKESRTLPLPMIPPASLSAGISYEPGVLTVGTKVRHSFKQKRIGEFETPTDAFTVLNAYLLYRFNSSGMLHTLSLNVDNLLNTEYYHHLSRIKELYPEPGRSFNLLYRVYF